MVYCPAPLVKAMREPSMSTSLDASTVTPGSRPPVSSTIAPAMVLWAWVVAGRAAAQASRNRARATNFIDPPP